MTLYGTDNPRDIISRATEQATALADVIKQRHLYADINGKQHVLIEGWTLLGSLVGVYAVPVWTKPIEGGWEARVEARTMSGAVVGAAEAECLRDERQWATRDDYALRSMAQTRASAKALRLPLGFIMQLAGFDPTPADEMPRNEPQQTAPARNAAPAPRQPQAPNRAPGGAVCPKCSGPMWSNIEKKARGEFLTSPNYSCKDKACRGAIWDEPEFGPESERGEYDEADLPFE